MKRQFLIYVVTAECQRGAPITVSGGLTLDSGDVWPIVDCGLPGEESHVWILGVYDDEAAAHAAHEAIKNGEARTPAAAAALLNAMAA